ncbi:hypothetical protein CDAR_592451 [Caerostris darwini]|uniref:Uncharacterized protein n=1 Tax=Caerostris darwini TaxID=1538125 RepID=A0AAV4V8F0_9ARAC|nr:hypothetical protein CDAR_592451 [Caerostris darwini]
MPEGVFIRRKEIGSSNCQVEYFGLIKMVSPKKTPELYQSEELKASESQTGLSIECATKSKEQTTRLQRKPQELYQSEELKASESQTGLSIECATKSKEQTTR